MKLSRVASYLFLASLFGVIIIWGYLPRVWLMGWPQLALLGCAAGGLVAWFVFSLDHLRLWIKQRSTQFGISLAVTATMSIVLLASVNWIANSYNVKKDLTQNQLHTLSDQTKRIAAGLKDTITIRVWSTAVDRMSANMDMKRFLENYKKAGQGKIAVEIKNPNEDRPGAAADNVKRDNLIIIKSGAGREARIENFTDTKGEEQITNAMIQAIKGAKKMVCFLSGHGELSLTDTEAQGLSSLKTQLTGAAYDAKEIILATSEKMPSDCEALVIVGPRSEAVEREVKMLHEYFDNGGKGILLMGPGTPPGWRKFTAEFGVNVRADVIIDPRVSPPIAIATKNYAQDIDITKSFNRLVVLPETSSIDVAAKSPKDGETVRVFVSSEGYTFAKTGDLKNVKSVKQSASDARGPLPVAVLIKRTIHDAAPAKPAPVKKDADKTHGALERKHGAFSFISEARAQEDEGGDPMAGIPTGAPPGAKDGPKPQKSEMAIILVSNHNFIMNSFVTQVGNLDLFLNTVNYLLKDQDLIGIRPREIRQAALELSRENLRQVYATVLLISLAFLVGGIMARRRKSVVGL